MPHWFLPLLALIGLGTFIYLGFWHGLSNAAGPDSGGGGSNNMTSGAGGVGDIGGGGHGGDAGHH